MWRTSVNIYQQKQLLMSRKIKQYTVKIRIGSNFLFICVAYGGVDFKVGVLTISWYIKISVCNNINIYKHNMNRIWYILH